MLGKILERLSRILDDLAIPYMVIGGQAVLIHGEPRFTRDIDVTLAVELDSLPRLLEAVNAAGWKPRPENPTDFVRDTFVLPCMDPETGIGLDFIFGLTAYERDAVGRAQLTPFERVPVRVATAPDLVIHKIIAGRPRDMEDVAGILVLNPNLDKNWIIGILREFEQELEASLVERFEEIWRKAREV